MEHADYRHYAQKHHDKQLDSKIASFLEQESISKTISCRKLHDIAKKLEIEPKEVGIQADLMELRLKKCQIGLFGYEPDGKNFNEDIEISEALYSEIKNNSQENRITCSLCWKIASKLNISRIDVGSACEKMGIKIKQCQLGAF